MSADGGTMSPDAAPMAQADIAAWDELALDARRSKWRGRGIPHATPSRRRREAMRRAAAERAAGRKERSLF